MGDETDYHAGRAAGDRPPEDRRKEVVPPWPSRDIERHWHTYGIAGTLLIMTIMGFFLVDILHGVRDNIQEVKITVKENAASLVEVQKKLVAVATKETMLRESFKEHQFLHRQTHK